eukprot:2438067-Heterocapsa_arctica.AAC.1
MEPEAGQAGGEDPWGDLARLCKEEMSICNRASEEAHRAWAAASAEISRVDAKPEDLDRLQQEWKETCEL